MSSIGQIPCQCPLTSCHFSLTPYRTYKQAAKQQETTSHSTTSISLLSFSFFFTAPSISLPARVSCSPDMASFRSSGAPNLLPLCCGSRASPYNHHSLTFSARSYFPTAVCSLLSHSLSLPPPSLPLFLLVAPTPATFTCSEKGAKEWKKRSCFFGVSSCSLIGRMVRRRRQPRRWLQALK